MNANPSLLLAPLRFELSTEHPGFEDFSGSIWHGGLGKMLHRDAPNAYAALYGGNDGEARLYSIVPPEALPSPRGSGLIRLGVTLYGEAVRHLAAVTHAIHQLGETGIGAKRIPYHLLSATLDGPDKTGIFYHAQQGWLSQPSPWPLMAPEPAPSPAPHVEIRFLTPLRIKEGNSVRRNPPTMELIVRRLMGRISQLCFATGSASPVSPEVEARLLDEARAVQLAHARVQEVNIERYSARSRKTMPFDGLQGQLVFSGDLRFILPWLELGHWLQLGGKVAFGMGCFEVISVKDPISKATHTLTGEGHAGKLTTIKRWQG